MLVSLTAKLRWPLPQGDDRSGAVVVHLECCVRTHYAQAANVQAHPENELYCQYTAHP